MKVADLKEILSEYSDKELIKIAVELYMLVPNEEKI